MVPQSRTRQPNLEFQSCHLWGSDRPNRATSLERGSHHRRGSGSPKMSETTDPYGAREAPPKVKIGRVLSLTSPLPPAVSSRPRPRAVIIPVPTVRIEQIPQSWPLRRFGSVSHPLVGGPSLSLENGGVELLAFPAGRRDVLELLARTHGRHTSSGNEDSPAAAAVRHRLRAVCLPVP